MKNETLSIKQMEENELKRLAREYVYENNKPPTEEEFDELYPNAYVELDKSDTCEIGMYRGFIAGYECALKNKWHDLRVNPNDLPDENVDVIVVTKRDVRTMWHRRWNKRIAVWDEYFFDWDEIVAWMPIPEFKQNK
ncbi:MAG: hypothetical protein ACRCZY_07875 [Phocaeicola sp.]